MSRCDRHCKILQVSGEVAISDCHLNTGSQVDKWEKQVGKTGIAKRGDAIPEGIKIIDRWDV